MDYPLLVYEHNRLCHRHNDSKEYVIVLYNAHLECLYYHIYDVTNRVVRPEAVTFVHVVSDVWRNCEDNVVKKSLVPKGYNVVFCQQILRSPGELA